MVIESEGWEMPETLTSREVLLLAAFPDRSAAEVLDPAFDVEAALDEEDPDWRDEK